MNSYNENLRSTAVALLQTEELNQKSMRAQREASMFSLYAASGARITAAGKFNHTADELNVQEDLKEQAIINNVISDNLLTSANIQKQSTAQSVTGVAICAANIQVAANAIVRLAADMGSVFSIVNAADFGSDMYMQSEEAYRLMNETAAAAERLSQQAMNASALTAEVSSATVAEKAKAVNTSIGNFLSVISNDYDVLAGIYTADNDALSGAGAAEKKAEAGMEINDSVFNAAQAAYMLNNKELNLDLNVPESKFTADSFTVVFDHYKNPFEKELEQKNSERKNSLQEINPVDNYYILLVKDSKKATFSFFNAEAVITGGSSRQLIRIPGAPGKHQVKKQIFMADTDDADGDPVSFGEKYVVFVLAVLTTNYKKSINNFDDYLSAPSAAFTLTKKLSGPSPKDIAVSAEMSLEFTLTEEKDNEVEYRCMLLPVEENLVKGIKSAKKTKPDFIFNRFLAEQVTSANYKTPLPAGLKKTADTKDPALVKITGTMKIDPATFTDVFGNLLVEEKNYIPVVLSYANVPPEKMNQYSNSLSAYTDTNSFKYIRKPSALSKKK